MRVVGAVDIGASGGRVVAGLVDDGRVALDVVHRFPNGVAEHDGHLRWNLTGLFEHVLAGLSALAAKYPQTESLGIDTWAVDYGLLDADGALLAEPVAYRDDRTAAVIDAVHGRVSPAELFAINGLQFLPFNTIYQLAAEQRGPLWERATRAVLIPDLLAYWLTGTLASEYTNGTTTGLVDVATGDWSGELLDRVGIPPGLFAPIDRPGARRGVLLPAIAARTGLPAGTLVTAVGSHDTASAVVGVPAAAPGFAFVASGTWSLVGVSRERPITTDAARAANFTNEGGVDASIRFLRNVGGLWLLQECLREWDVELAPLLAAAAVLPAGGAQIDVDDPAWIAPGGMPARIGAGDPATTTRCILDSLAAGYARTLDQAADLAGESIDAVHVVGGGSQNELLCRLTAAATGRRVIAGPAEATALGNALVQARAIGAITDLRAAAAASSATRAY